MGDAYVVNAIYLAEEGKENALEQHLRAMIVPTRDEPGCVHYQVHRSTDNPRRFLLFEHYSSHDGFEFHKATPHFETHIKHGAWPLLESRDATFWHLIDG